MRQATIQYNFLNLPFNVIIGDDSAEGNRMMYFYDASGRKWRREVYAGETLIHSTTYLGPAVFDSSDTLSIYHSAGRLRLAGSIPEGHEYSLRDHLGNERVRIWDRNHDGALQLSTDPQVHELISITDYYPFGLPHVDYAEQPTRSNRHLYNGKELETAYQYQLYDYAARWYDPALGRFTGVDPLADHPNQVDKSPYAAMWNNPIKYNDPDGRCPQCLVGFAIGFGLDVATQMIFEGKSLREVNYASATISGVTGAVSGGISSVAKLGKVTQIAVNATLDASESVGKQVVSGNDISFGQVASDVIMGGIGGQVKIFDDANIKVKENTLDRAERIVANRIETGKKVSSGRIQNVKDAQSSLNTANRINDAAGTATGNTLQTASDNVRSFLNTGNGSSIYISPQTQMTQDNTRVVMPIIDRKLK